MLSSPSPERRQASQPACSGRITGQADPDRQQQGCWCRVQAKPSLQRQCERDQDRQGPGTGCCAVWSHWHTFSPGKVWCGRPQSLAGCWRPPCGGVTRCWKWLRGPSSACLPLLNSLDATDTLDALVFGRMGSPEELINGRHPMLGWNAQEVQGKARPTDAEAAALGPEFKEAWDREFRDHPEKPMVIFTALGGFGGYPSLATGDPGLAISTFTVYPFSRGHIHITGPQLEDPLDFDAGFFADPGGLDIKKHQWTYKKQQEIMRRMPSSRGEMAACRPPFAPGSQAATVSLEDGPLPADVPDIEYSAEDDAVLERWLRENVSTTWHSLGTCKMAPRNQTGVVDANLGVYGVERLKIADMSIVPRNIAANTTNTALAIGKKAADIFINELVMSSK
ncbi:hypothetical protein VTI74DRAFT_10132 [Chaetomium olivicolor]